MAGEERHFPALVLNEGIVTIDTHIEREKWLNVSIHMRLKDNVIEVDYDNKKISAMAPLQGTKSVSALFGKMESYHVTDFGANYTYKNYEFFAKVNNIFDEKNGVFASDGNSIGVNPVNFERTFMVGFNARF